MELIQIVDENGKFTGEVVDKDYAHDHNLLHNEVAIFILNSKGETLLQKRSGNKRYNPNKWAICSGHVDAYESLEDAALREVKEEIGLTILKDELCRYKKSELILRESNSHTTHYFYFKTDKKANEFTIQEEELSEVKWVDIDKVIRMIKDHDNIVFGEDKLMLFEGLKTLC